MASRIIAKDAHGKMTIGKDDKFAVPAGIFMISKLPASGTFKMVLDAIAFSTTSNPEEVQTLTAGKYTSVTNVYGNIWQVSGLGDNDTLTVSW